MKISVCLIDNHQMVRQGLRRILESANLEIVSELGSCREFQKTLQTGLSANLLILEICLPDGNGFKILQQIKKSSPAVAVLICSMHADSAIELEAMRLGADGYITKQSTAEELIKAVRTISRGGKHFASTLTPAFGPNANISSALKKHEKLSRREFEVLALLAQGKSHVKIGRELNISPKTVSSFRSRILEKLGVKSNADLVRYALEYGIVSKISQSSNALVESTSPQPVQHEGHFVQFYVHEETLIGALAEYARQGLSNGEGVVILATKAHQGLVLDELKAEIPQVGKMVEAGQLLFIDAFHALQQLMPNGLLNRDNFDQLLHPILNNMKSRFPRVRIFGELVNILWQMGHGDVASELERYWSEILASDSSLNLMCAYSTSNFGTASPELAAEQISRAHCCTIPAENADAINDKKMLYKKIGKLKLRATDLRLFR